MTYFKDLTIYSYHQSGIANNTLNIGWLDAEFPYNTGSVPAVCIDRLWKLLQIKLVHLRGLHYCNLCKPILMKPHIVVRDGKTLKIGSGEVRVFSKGGIIYAAPNLIYHYITDHNYKPPDEFIQAVLDCPLPGSDEYRETLKRYGLINDFQENLY